MSDSQIRPWIDASEAAAYGAAALDGALQNHWRNYCTVSRERCRSGPPTALPEVRQRRLQMLLAIEAFGAGLAEPDRQRFHRRLDYGNLVSTPLLIATQAVLVGEPDTGGGRRFHDKAAAEAAYALLREVPGMDLGLAGTVARIVSLKNPVRNAVGEDKEVVVWDGRRIVTDDEAVSAALGSFLRPALATSPGLLEALTALVAAVESRSGRQPRNHEFLDQYRRLCACQAEDAPPPADPPPLLVALEFAHHALPDAARRMTQFAEIVERVQATEPGGLTAPLLWVSADRFFASEHPEDFDKRLRLAEHLAPFPPTTIEPLEVLFGAGRASLHYLHVSPERSFSLVFGMDPPPGGVWHELQAVFAAQPAGPISLGFVLFACAVMSQLRPADFLQVQVIVNHVPSPLAPVVRLYLPREAPVADADFTARVQAWAAGGPGSKAMGRDARFLVAAAAGAVVPNRALFFGVEKQTLWVEDPADDGPRTAWTRVLRVVREAARHDAISDYLHTFAKRPELEHPPRFVPRAVSTERPVALGCDIGASNVKIALYRLHPASLEVVARIGGELSMTVQRPGGERYANALALAERVAETCKAAFGSGWDDLRRRIVAVGVAWPGAVTGGPGAEEVAAPSSVLRYFEPFPPERHWEATPEQLRALDLRGAFEATFGGDQRPAVRLANDGTCHVTAGARDFQQAVGAGGETVAALTIGTSIALKFYDTVLRQALDMLCEVGRMIIYPGEPPVGGYPGGTARSLMKSESLGELATALLNGAGHDHGLPAFAAHPQELTFVVGWLLAEADGTERADAERLFERHWAAWWPQSQEPVEGLPALRTRLRQRLARLGRWPDEHEFAQAVARRAGAVLADIVASTAAMTDPRTFLIGGGPLSGSTGRFVREAARQLLRTRFNFHVDRRAGGSEDPRPGRPPRQIRMPEPARSSADLGPGGCLGAALLARALLAPARVPAAAAAPLQDTRARPGFVALPRLSTYSVIEFGNACRGEAVFPGAAHVPAVCHGYVRSTQRRDLARVMGKHPQELPWRDYPEAVLTPAQAVAGNVRSGHAVLLSARNTLNEAFHACRIAGRWFQRSARREDVPAHWPVLVLGAGPARMARYDAAAGADGTPDLVAGVPLAIDGVPSSRAFLVAHCSDVAHVWDVDPQGRRGTSREVWQVLSDRWQQGLNAGETDEQQEAAAREIAERHGVRESTHLLHSVLARRRDGSLFAFAATGSLRQIGRTLVERWDIADAIVLDNGGSVGWMAVEPGGGPPTLVVAGPNYRPRGTVFIVMHTGRFLHPQAHGQLAGSTQEVPDGAPAA